MAADCCVMLQAWGLRKWTIGYRVGGVRPPDWSCLVEACSYDCSKYYFLGCLYVGHMLYSLNPPCYIGGGAVHSSGS